MRDRNTKNELWDLLDNQYEGNQARYKKRKRENKRKDSIERSVLAEQLNKEEDNFNFTYQPSRHEQQWISSALREFYLDSMISDVLHVVRGGKEANVYCCKGHPAIGLDLLAAKIYRPRLLRNLKNDSLYKEGRVLLGDDGKTMRDQRSQRAVAKKTRIGGEMSITSWIEHEFQTLQQLHAAGADVPMPVAQNGNAILMEYIGEANAPAPVLHEVRLDPSEAPELFARLLRNVELLLAHNRIHADLSSYNVLYWEGEVKIIDFPQVVDPLYNNKGYQLLLRDIERLCQYFGRYGINANPASLASDLWSRYLRGEFG
ncbi:MAG: hypothetical protein EHM70_17270 [Chloroflexota bacterium]|nr:MAG: hypothetical protein EHM70_17270 [Chloroflexota bacterium]